MASYLPRVLASLRPRVQWSHLPKRAGEHAINRQGSSCRHCRRDTPPDPQACPCRAAPYRDSELAQDVMSFKTSKVAKSLLSHFPAKLTQLSQIKKVAEGT